MELETSRKRERKERYFLFKTHSLPTLLRRRERPSMLKIENRLVLVHYFPIWLISEMKEKKQWFS